MFVRKDDVLLPFGKWKDFDSCVADFVSQGKDQESAQKICGALQARLGKESFSWTASLEPFEKDGKSLIRGKALHPVKTVHPEEWPGIRVYLEEELQKAASTLVGQPLLLDHMYPLDGRVLATGYEDGAIEYVAELNDERVLEWIRDGTIKHCSVEYDWSSLAKVNGVAPQGIQFTGLALLKNFEPGDPESSVQVWEGLINILKEAKEKMSEQRGDRGSVSAEASEAEKRYRDLQDAVAILAEEKSRLQAKVNALEQEKADLTRRLGEGIIEPSSSQHSAPEDYVCKEAVLSLLPARIPMYWGHGPTQMIRRLEALCGGRGKLQGPVPYVLTGAAPQTLKKKGGR